jgi:hypothetical protein
MLLQSHRGWSGVREVVLLREEVVVVGGGVIVGGVSQTVAQLIVILTRVWQRRWRLLFSSAQLTDGSPPLLCRAGQVTVLVAGQVMLYYTLKWLLQQVRAR